MKVYFCRAFKQLAAQQREEEDAARTQQWEPGNVVCQLLAVASASACRAATPTLAQVWALCDASTHPQKLCQWYEAKILAVECNIEGVWLYRLRYLIDDEEVWHTWRAFRPVSEPLT